METITKNSDGSFTRKREVEDKVRLSDLNSKILFIENEIKKLQEQKNMLMAIKDKCLAVREGKDVN